MYNSLEEISKQDSKWRNTARSICGNKTLADDIVQEMYLKIADKVEGNRTVNNRYIYRTMLSVFLNHCSRNKYTSLTEYNLNQPDPEPFNPTDEQLKLLERIDLLKWHQKELLEESYDRSLRQIEKEYNINYGYVYRQITIAKKIVNRNNENQ